MLKKERYILRIRKFITRTWSMLKESAGVRTMSMFLHAIVWQRDAELTDTFVLFYRPSYAMQSIVITISGCMIETRWTMLVSGVTMPSVHHFVFIPSAIWNARKTSWCNMHIYFYIEICSFDNVANSCRSAETDFETLVYDKVLLWTSAF